ncbi:TPA: hypothetical protein N5L33_004792 [Enterobacter cloacae subsp. cloacae]|nr:hypothetical protein [Enterobacter cloacae subsp. cloacae]HCM9271113.1 hypothetical protein [Enterobacter cloacae subsp. cloacae]HCM9540486.1 hypothetical protein [Enterobacter cloacae subsp. cloacae]HCM9542737.1 hypothetical protein [Enterobacter cloacae subsp. cloacae]
MEKRYMMKFPSREKMKKHLNKHLCGKHNLIRKNMVGLLAQIISQEEKAYLRLKQLVAELDLDAKDKKYAIIIKCATVNKIIGCAAGDKLSYY